MYDNKILSMKTDQITIGVCYYPEFWPKELWRSDLERMVSYGIQVVRIAEFAWSTFEPEEGVFQFGLFDEFLDLTEEFGIKVIMCTTGATPPSWLTYKYPEVLNTTMEGVKYQHGQRRHCNFNAPIYRHLLSIITELLAERYSKHPSVEGWQIDNEMNCEVSVYYSEADNIAFREFLRNKYHTLDELNSAWGTNFWSQTYSEWEQVFLTRATPSDSPNPHLVLDEKRFISESVISFTKMHTKIIKKYIRPGQYITTNGIFDHIDNHRFTKETLDFMSFDSYPNFAFALYTNPKAKGMNDRWSSKSLSMLRSISENFAVMEQQSNGGGWVNRLEQPAPKPGQMRLWTYQSIANGANMVNYFRWRTATAGTEIYWHGLNDYHNKENRRLKELKIITEEVKKLSSLANSEYIAEVAIAFDYDNKWDGEFDKWHGPLSRSSEDAWYEACQLKHIPTNFIYLNEDTEVQELSKYKLIIYPHAAIMTQKMVEVLTQYVMDGGTLIMGARTGYKDKTGQCYRMDMPGYAKDLFGIRVDDYTMIGPFDEPQFVKWNDVYLPSDKFCDILEVVDKDTVPLGFFTEDYYINQPGLCKKVIGKGSAYYFGGGFTKKTADIFLEILEVPSLCQDIIDAPAEVELILRKKEDAYYLFILNYKAYPMTLHFKKECINMITNDTMNGEITLKGYDVIIAII